MKKTYFWKARGAWYVKSDVGKSQVFLHEDEGEAYRIWGDMMAAAHPESPVATFAVIAENYLVHAEKALGPKQYAEVGAAFWAYAKCYYMRSNVRATRELAN